MIRLLLADDKSRVRAGLKLLIALERDMQVVGEANDGIEAIDLARQLRPDVVIMDVRMPEMDGIEAAGTLRPVCPVIILTLHDSADCRRRAKEAGVAAFVSKQGDPRALITAIREVANARPCGGGEISKQA